MSKPLESELGVFDVLVENAGEYIHTNPWLAIVSVFVGGVLTASNPCVLAMVPLMMGLVTGTSTGRPSVLRSLVFSGVFVTGLAITFTVMGMVAALAGRMYGDISGAWNLVVAVVCIIMGLHLAEVVQIPIPALGPVSATKLRGPLGALVLGLLFGLVSAPCAAPILVVLLTYLAGSGASVSYGGLLLLIYALGHSALILVAGTSMGVARVLIENKRMTKVTGRLRQAAGLIIVLVGLYFGYKGLI